MDYPEEVWVESLSMLPLELQASIISTLLDRMALPTRELLLERLIDELRAALKINY